MALLKVVSGENPREIATQVLGRREGTVFVEELLEQALTASKLSSPDRRLCQELVYGVVRWERTLDWLISRKTQGRLQKRGLQNLLRLGLYQIFWMDRIPDHAAVHQTVELARRAGFGPQSGFINAVLRGYLREADATAKALEELKTSQPGIGYSHPDWLVAKWQARWGPAQAALLMGWDNTPPPTFARVNTLKAADAGKLLEQWREENVEYDFVRRDWFEDNLVFELKAHPPLAKLPSFQQGLFYIQDPSTLLAVGELAPQPGESVLDLCAAPGGKLTYISQLMRNEGKLVGCDLSEDRRGYLCENCARLGVKAELLVLQLDASGTSSGAGGLGTTEYDRVLVDAPCSNTGVIRRRIDLRSRVRSEEIERLRAVQLALLQAAAAHVRKGGVLVYSTCSLEEEENERVRDQFLATHPWFKAESTRQLTPFADNVDGAFVVRFRKAA